MQQSPTRTKGKGDKEEAAGDTQQWQGVVPAQGGSKETAGTNVQKTHKSTGKNMPAPCQSWQVNNPWAHMDFVNSAAALLSLSCPWPKHLHPEQRLRASFGITHSAWMLRQWHLPKRLFSSYCCHYSHNWEQVPTADNVHIHVCGCPDYTKKHLPWATAPMITVIVKNLPLVLSQKAWKHGVSAS